MLPERASSEVREEGERVFFQVEYAFLFLFLFPLFSSIKTINSQSHNVLSLFFKNIYVPDSDRSR